jgi:hypothetical protein
MNVSYNKEIVDYIANEMVVDCSYFGRKCGRKRQKPQKFANFELKTTKVCKNARFET